MASELRKRVKMELVRLDMTQNDLVNIINDRLGYAIDSSYLGKVLDGKYKKSKILDVVSQELGVKLDSGGGRKSGRV